MHADAAGQQQQQQQQQQQEKLRAQRQEAQRRQAAQQGGAGGQVAEGEGAADEGPAPPPVDDRSWLQKNWMLLIPSAVIMLNRFGGAGREAERRARARMDGGAAPAGGR